MRNDPNLKLTNYGGLAATLDTYNIRLTDLVHYNMLYLLKKSNNSIVAFSCEQLIFNFSGKGEK